MCGITGFWQLKESSSPADLKSLCGQMTQSIAHRGPDSDGIWIEEKHGVALGHRRLAILDLSPEGAQPMVSASGRFVLCFNGEVYNFQFLKSKLVALGVSFRGSSDTEVMLAAFEAWGVEAVVPMFNGMFAFALWDTQEQILYLVRDRLGIKPLYYGLINNKVGFASELNPLKIFFRGQLDINLNALGLFCKYNNIPAPFSIYQHIFKLEAGRYLKITNQRAQLQIQEETYWSLPDVVAEAKVSPFMGSETEALERLETLLKDAIQLRMIADVPLGAFLSGGIDSSTVVALMQSMHQHSVKTFTIGFEEKVYNEATYAQAIAQHLGTDHTELYVSDQETRDIIPKLPEMYDEPFADASQIPTYLVSKLARTQVTVSLSGDGGDELFAGYNRHIWGTKVWHQLQKYPHFLKRGGQFLLSKQLVTKILLAGHEILPKALQASQPTDKLQKMRNLLSMTSQEALYDTLLSDWQEHLVSKATIPQLIQWQGEVFNRLSFTEKMMLSDALFYLPNDVLTKVDRASMQVALEARVPILDHRVVELAWRLPLSMKVKEGQSKWLLRQLLYKYVPKTMIERPKMGFGVPIDSWLRKELKDWAATLLSEEKLNQTNYFDTKLVRKAWETHLSGKQNLQNELWNVLMFQAWLEKN